ncbi:4a-hydroxytetrahydrobiopterin dehydratase [Flavobacterium sp.]|uniref:4a-hydroxytetrahydrobiopterin dehydratase n=1 Tax=Flavobacterium sp. TaxID=239 RepID=UPI0025C69E12|nr:4a-hydroxytetrahydrobiopterin dehydratase [Flavobacterium sp.]MBA4154121.1 4a-hydroxytetrahydrobiopterin dehydratase [Flavobacterium sp.]
MIYNKSTIQKEIQELKGWGFKDNAIDKAYVFKNFLEALAFIVQVGCLSEKQNHHAEIWNVYNKVTLRLSTHDAGGVTDKDIKLAAAIDKLA